MKRQTPGVERAVPAKPESTFARRALAALPLLALIALAVLFGVFSLKRNPQVETRATVGKPMPQLVLPTLDDGAPTPLGAATAGGPVLVNFFASWCAPCEIEHPTLMALKAENVRIVGIAYKDAPENTRAFLGRLGHPFEQTLVDRDGRAGIEFGVTGVPETYLIGRDGVILAKHTGPMSRAQAAKLLEQGR